MTQTANTGVDSLRAALEGSVITPEDSGYAGARKVWNADIDCHPAVIAQCRSAEDVAAAIGYALDSGLEVAVRGGAHSAAGTSTCDGGLVVDLRHLARVTVDPKARRAKVGGGALLAEVDAATQEHGLAVTTGNVGHTGIGGLTLGGGIGWLTRQAGLTIDNLISAQVVLADQRIVRAAEDDNPDLFWAIRGGGGNFGVVTEFEFRLHEVGPIVQFGLFFWSLPQAAEAMHLARDLNADSPRSVSIDLAVGLSAPPAPFVPEQHRGETGCAVMVAGFGSPDEHAAVVERIRTTLPPTFDFVTPMPYVALQQMMDEAMSWGFHCYEKGAYFADLTDDLIAVLVDHAPKKTSPLSAVLIARLDGAYCETGEDDTAFGGDRTPRYVAFMTGICPDPGMLPAERDWVRSLWQETKPYMIGTSSYVNLLLPDEEQRVIETYGHKYQRLVDLKRHYDSQNVFHRNMNIRPGA